MITRARGTVSAITRADVDCVALVVVDEKSGAERAALAYPALVGPVAVGDQVLLNTTATTLNLGTGGWDFVIHNASRSDDELLPDPDAHIVKLRYTPLQHAVCTAEMDPRHAAVWEQASTLAQTPVVACGLHSQIAPVCAAIKAARPDARVVYVMTDQAALPLAVSNLVRHLKAADLLDATITTGQAFGGDWECVSVPSALLAARWIAHADVIVIGQGPGNAGTGTRWGFGGIEQGSQLDLAGRLGGAPIGVLRLSNADKRGRHHGLSHHSVTALGLLAHTCALVAFPAGEAFAALRKAVDDSPIAALHTVAEADGAPGLALLAARNVRATSMGRGTGDDPVFFHAAAAAGALAASCWAGGWGDAVHRTDRPRFRPH